MSARWSQALTTEVQTAPLFGGGLVLSLRQSSFSHYGCTTVCRPLTRFEGRRRGLARAQLSLTAAAPLLFSLGPVFLAFFHVPRDTTPPPDRGMRKEIRTPDKVRLTETAPNLTVFLTCVLFR